MEYSLDVEPIGSTSFIVRTTLEVRGELPGSTVIYNARVVLTDGIHNIDSSRLLQEGDLHLGETQARLLANKLWYPPGCDNFL